ncbi:MULTISPECIES: M20/M25/M40 family metallo-hydrolase [Streptomyces]|uniref:M20 family metallopeptidase n=1 Tax=Streptomyces TaxID=1883 RepID=UPI0029700707|nr:M20/M25/M40 family metallo-hydrolase [Streptomyces californicus]MDW4898848.1 M20/M25/M40 family metallo-hydrolase [Streptomyces californicus]
MTTSRVQGRGATAGADAERMLALARRLIGARSENPGGSEWPVVDILAEVLADSADETRVVECAPGRPNLLARYGACDGVRPVLLVTAATDTVPADAARWRHPPFGGEHHDGELWGRGAVDMKGAIAAVVEAALRHRERGCPGGQDLILAFTADGERGGGAGWQRLAGELPWARPDGALLVAPTSLVPHRRERGVVWLGVDLYGRAAPASCAEEGTSAVVAACALVQEFPGVAASALLRGGGGAGPVTVTAGRIAGGDRVNLVPGHCRVEFDLRLPPGSVDPDEERLAELVAGCLPAGVRARTELLMLSPASETSASEPLWHRLLDLGRAHGLTTGADPVYAGPTDARHLRGGLGVPTLLCGPGDQRRAHQVDERVPLTELTRAVALYEDLFAPGHPPHDGGRATTVHDRR